MLRFLWFLLVAKSLLRFALLFPPPPKFSGRIPYWLLNSPFLNTSVPLQVLFPFDTVALSVKISSEHREKSWISYTFLSISVLLPPSILFLSASLLNHILLLTYTHKHTHTHIPPCRLLYMMHIFRSVPEFCGLHICGLCQFAICIQAGFNLFFVCLHSLVCVQKKICVNISFYHWLSDKILIFSMNLLSVWDLIRSRCHITFAFNKKQ